jgi:hypothetical protein
VAKALLGYERTMIADVFGPGGRGRDAATGNSLVELARRYLGERDGVIADPVLRDRLAQVSMDERCFALTMQRRRSGVHGARSASRATLLAARERR